MGGAVCLLGLTAGEGGAVCLCGLTCLSRTGESAFSAMEFHANGLAADVGETGVGTVTPS